MLLVCYLYAIITIFEKYQTRFSNYIQLTVFDSDRSDWTINLMLKGFWFGPLGCRLLICGSMYSYYVQSLQRLSTRVCKYFRPDRTFKAKVCKDFWGNNYIDFQYEILVRLWSIWYDLSYTYGQWHTLKYWAVNVLNLPI